VRWTGLDEAVHTDQPDPASAGRSCLTARPAAADPAGAAPLYRHPDDQLGKRWSPMNTPTFLPGLLRAHLDGTEPTMRGHRDHEATSPYANDNTDNHRRRGLVEQHLAVRVPPTSGEPPGRITVHPDIPFALAADRPAGATRTRSGLHRWRPITDPEPGPPRRRRRHLRSSSSAARSECSAYPSALYLAHSSCAEAYRSGPPTWFLAARNSGPRV